MIEKLLFTDIKDANSLVFINNYFVLYIDQFPLVWCHIDDITFVWFTVDRMPRNALFFGVVVIDPKLQQLICFCCRNPVCMESELQRQDLFIMWSAALGGLGVR